MRCFLLPLVLAACPPLGLAGPADGRAPTAPAQGRDAASGGGTTEPGKDQRRAALRQALVPVQDAVPAGTERPSGRQLSPTERAELRRQLRDQSSR